MPGGRPRRDNWWKDKNRAYIKEVDTWDQTTSKYVEFENWTGLNFNVKSKMVKHYCNGSCKRHADFDPRKLIHNGYLLGFRRCIKCGYFKTTQVFCPCCNQRLRYSNRQKNHPNKNNKREFKEY